MRMKSPIVYFLPEFTKNKDIWFHDYNAVIDFRSENGGLEN